jgi:hypothetical protein
MLNSKGLKTGPDLLPENLTDAPRESDLHLFRVNTRSNLREDRFLLQVGVPLLGELVTPGYRNSFGLYYNFLNIYCMSY